METLGSIRRRYFAEQRKAVLLALMAEGWNLLRASKRLRASVSSVQRVLQANPDIEAMRQERRAA